MRLLVSVGLMAALLLGSAGRVQAGFVTNTLGSAGPSFFTVLDTLSNGNVSISGAMVNGGNALYQPQPLPNGGVAGNVGVQNGNVSNSATITGSILTGQSAAAAAAASAASTFSGLSATPGLPSSLNSTQTITAVNQGGLNVLNVSAINLSGTTLTFSGSAGTQFVVNVNGGLTLQGASKIVLTGGLNPDDVVFNVTNGDVAISGGLNQESEINGIVLDGSGQIHVTPGLVFGELIAGNNINIASGGEIVPAPSALILMGLGGLVFAGLMVVRSRHPRVAA